MAQYLIYTINPKWSAGTRIEWFRDDDGDRVAGVGNVNLGWTAAPGFVGTFTEWTTGLNYRPCPNLVIRPEIRCDWYSGSAQQPGPIALWRRPPQPAVDVGHRHDPDVLKARIHTAWPLSTAATCRPNPKNSAACCWHPRYCNTGRAGNRPAQPPGTDSAALPACKPSAAPE